MKFKKTLLVFSLLLILACILAACGKDAPASTSENEVTTTVVTTAVPEEKIVINEDYVITLSENADDYVSKICKSIKNAIDDASGLSLKVRDDWLKPGSEAPVYEIVVGRSNRDGANAIADALKENEWCVTVSETKVYISGNTARALSDAANYFIENYVKGKSEIALPTDTYHAETNKFLAISFSDVEPIKVTPGPTYPRLYKLSSGTLLCGVDGHCYWSNDDGATWKGGTDYRREHIIKGEDGRKYTLSCANTAFYELDDGTVLVAYRATGYIAMDESLYCTRIIVSQSKDGGKTWKFHSLMCDYRNEIASGVWEPHFGTIDGVLTCFYANDSHTVLEPPYQHIEYLQWINGEWTNRTIVANGVKHESRDGMPVWQQLSNGKYVCIIEGWVPGGVTLSVQILWSDDGVNWSEPVIIYRAKNGSCGAPYVLELPTGQLLVTFQTNENFEGDTPHSEPIMYMMLSDGTPVEYLTAENFSKPENAFNIEPGEYGLWNCAYLSDKYLYIGTDTNDGDNKGVCIKRIALEELYKQLEN